MTKDEALAQLRELCPPGVTVYTVLRHVSRSGMSRSISAFVKGPDGELRNLDYLLTQIGEYKRDRQHDGIKMGGRGMDMGFALVYGLSYSLHPKGFGCTGERCPSNDHSNGDRDYTPHGTLAKRVLPSDAVVVDVGGYQHWHKSPGYSLRQRWI